MEMNEVDGFPCKAYFIAVILYPVCGNKINELNVLSQNCIVTYPCGFKWVYGNPGAFLVGIRRIPAYHVDYTTGDVFIISLARSFSSEK